VPLDASTPLTSRSGLRTAFALFLVVFGGRAWLAGYAGSSLPLWDQWWSDVRLLVLPLAEGRLDWRYLTAPHNEHRLLGERLLTLAQIALSGRWEPRDGLVLSAAVRALGLAVVLLLLGRGQTRPHRVVLFVLLAAVGALPAGTFNLLSAFQVQFFICEPLTIAALYFLCGGTLTAQRVALGGGLLLLASVTMATPVITAVAAAAVLTLRLAVGGRREKGLTATVFYLAAFVLLLGVTTPVVVLYPARTVAEFVSSFARMLAWPFPDGLALAVLALLPPALLGGRLVREKALPGPAWFVLALSTTAVVQSAAAALARGGVRSEYPQYVDGIWLGHVAGFVALVEALRPPADRVSRWRSRACLVWAFWLGAGLLADVASRGVPAVQAVRTAVSVREPRFAMAVRTGDLAEFEAEARTVNEMLIAREFDFFNHPVGRFAIPGHVYPEFARARDRLLAWFPAALTGARPSWPSRAFATLSALGPWLAVLGVGLGVVSFRRHGRGGTRAAERDDPDGREDYE